MFEILVWLLVKHYICDFPLQAHPWLYSRKGDYGAPGGIAHALIHGAGSAVVLAALSIDIQLMTFLVAIFRANSLVTLLIQRPSSFLSTH